MTFKNFWLVTLILPFVYIIFFLKNHYLPHPKVKESSNLKLKIKFWLPYYIMIIGIFFIVLAIMRPQKEIKSSSKGIDMVVVLDISKSMDAIDMSPNRLAVAKEALKEFISLRKNDRIGLILFAGSIATKVPLTLDHEVYLNFLKKINTNDIVHQGTSIGLGIAGGLNRLKNSKAKSKVLILATDGQDNSPSITPQTAIKKAVEMDVKIYTIGIGSNDTIIPFIDAFGRKATKHINDGIDEELLKKIANQTGGKYYRAQSEESLGETFRDIDQLETSELKAKQQENKKELFHFLLTIGIILMVISIFVEELLFPRIP